MMESCMNSMPDNREQVEIDDLKRDLSSDFSVLLDPQQSREHLQVYLRIRPLTSAESDNGESQDCVTIEGPDTVLLKPPSASLSARLSTDKSLPQTGQRFQFSQVYGPDTTQRELFEGTVKDLVKDVLEGGNSLVFTYGVTNTGKTFTFLGPDADAGILPRSLDVIFSTIDERVFTGMSIKPHRCRDFTRLTWEQQADEAAFKRNLFRQLKDVPPREKSNTSLSNSTSNTLLEGSSMTVAAGDRISLEVEADTKFSVWVSFCEIYNENIHDLLEVMPSGALRRPALRLSQDIKGNAFVKDLRWVQVNSAEEAYKVMKLGKKNQSFSSTRLNQLSSRSHSIFSIRILRIEDVGTPRVHTMSELCLCDLAGSERCAKTQNKGERLKEAGNINTSLLILGKCINALRHNQQAKLLQHVPFRESKLTHYLQSFFCGRGKACMIVNINQCASMYDETLNVLKFSAVAQRVVVLTTRPLPIKPLRSASDVSLLVDNAESKALRRSRRSSLIGWESSLEDVQEDEDNECEEEETVMDDTMDQSDCEEDCDENDDKILIGKRTHQQQVGLLKQLQVQLKKERAESLLMEARVREEISREFSELFSEMQTDYNDRLVREREILEERAERRLEIFKNLVDKMATDGLGADAQVMDKSLDSYSSEMAGIKKIAEAAHKYLGSGRGGAQADRCDAVEKLERKILEMNEHQRRVQEQLAHKTTGEASGVEDEEKRKLLFQLQEKTSEVAQLQKHVTDLQSSCESEQLQELSVALEKEKKAREDALSALEYQTMGKEEALASLEEERKAREETLAALGDLRRSKEEVMASLEDERKGKEEAMASLEDERKGKEEAMASLEDERKGKEEAMASLEEERRNKEEAMASLEEERRDKEEAMASLEEQRRDKEEAMASLEEQRRDKEEAMASLKEERRNKEEAITALAEEKRSREELLAALGEEKIGQEDAQPVLERREITELVEEREKRQQEGDALRQEVRELTDKLKATECQVTSESQRAEQASVQLQAAQAQLDEHSKEIHEKTSQIHTLSLEVQSLKEELQTTEASSGGVDDQLREEVSDLRKNLAEEKDKSESKQKQFLELQDELAQAKEHFSHKQLIADQQLEELTEKLKQNASAETEAELRKKLLECEVQVKSLQKSLQEVQERREEEESQAVQEARRREVERRRELLAVAHEAIAQKDEELQKRAEEISRQKEKAEQDSEKVKSLGIDLQRKEEDASDLREKLADYKKQIQQVQKEISAMRGEEKVLRQKLSDVEKAKKQLQSDLANRDRTIQQLKVEQSSDTKSDQTHQLYQKACKDLEAKESIMEDMRLALTEQEETQEEMEQVLEEKLNLIQELQSEVEKLKGKFLQQDHGSDLHGRADSQSDDLDLAKRQAAQAQESLKLCAEKHQTERKKWMEEKLSLIGQAKEAEDKRSHELKKFAEDRERFARQQSQLDSLSSQLAEKEQTMEHWRKERDTLVSALEVQLQKLLSSQAEKDKLIQQLRQCNTQPPQEGVDGGVSAAELQAALLERETEVLRLKEELKAATSKQVEMTSQVREHDRDKSPGEESETIHRKSGGRRDIRTSVSSQGSAGYPSVLDSSEISTENGRMNRFPRPELEISFSPLQPNRMALRRQGEESAVTVKITRSGRKRKSAEMEKEEVEAENRRNTRTKLTPKMTPHQEERSSPARRHDSPGSSRSKKEGTLQKIGEFLQSSPTLLGSKAKKMMSLVSGRCDADLAASSSSSSSSLSLRAKKNKRKLYRPEISSPMDMPSHPIITRDPEEKDSDHQIIKRRLRSRMVK